MQRRHSKTKQEKAPARSQKSTIIDFPQHEQYRLYDMTEIAAILHVSHRFVKAIKDEGAPFVFNHTRPDWILEWLREHAQKFRDAKLCA
jgi:hypothetical protein